MHQTDVYHARGVGNYQLTPEAYAVIVRMLASNYKPKRIVDFVHERYPEHRPDGSEPVDDTMVKSIRRRRQPEIRELRERLNQEVDDLWIANKRTRLEALQHLFEDANRWTPTKVIEYRERVEEPDQERNPQVGDPVPGGPGRGDRRYEVRNLIVYEKPVDTLARLLKQAKEELGEDPGSRMANSLEELIKRAEEERGLEKTGDVGGTPPDGSVDYIEDAMVVEIPEEARSRGDALHRNQLDGTRQPDARGLEHRRRR